MKSTSSYKVKIINVNKSINETICIYREAVSYMIDVVSKNWKDVKILSAKSKVNYVEKLIHSTSKNLAPYDFDNRFYKFPSYMRRAAKEYKAFKEDEIVVGKIMGFHEFGIFVQLDKGIDAICSIPEYEYDKLKVGDTITIRIININEDKKNIRAKYMFKHND